MKKVVAWIVAFIICLSMGCGGKTPKKSEAVQSAEDAINAIGEITIDSNDAITKAEKLYGILTDTEKAQVSNRLELVEAREAFEKMQGEIVFENAKRVYEKLNHVADLCIDGMDDIYGAWYFGIYKASKSTTSSFYNDLAKETPHFSSSELSNAGYQYAKTNSYGSTEKAWSEYIPLTGQRYWDSSVTVVMVALEERGDYTTVKNELNEAQSILQELTKSYSDYTYYPKLKDYYAAVSAYADFFQSPTGSFEQLKDTINNYENSIRTYRSDTGFLFN